MSNSTPDNPTLTLTLMAGLPGVGKSTLAHLLGKELDWTVIKKDEVKEQLLRDGLGDDAASFKAYNLSFKAAREEEAQEIISDMMPARVRLKVLFLVVADRDLRNERIQQRPPQTTVKRVDPSNINDYLDHYLHLPLPPGSFYLDTSTHKPEDYQPRASYYLRSDDAKYDDDEEMLKRGCKTPVLS